MVAMLMEQQRLMLAREDKLRQDAEAKLEVKLEKQRLEAEAQRKEADAKLEKQGQEAEAKLEAQRKAAEAQKNDQQVAALQARLGALHASKLLADDELFALEDAVADALDAPDDDDRVPRMVALSARMAADASFARQLRRKFTA
jgi:hypothetical protein